MFLRGLGFLGEGLKGGLNLADSKKMLVGPYLSSWF